MAQPESAVPAQETALLISPDEEDHEILSALFKQNSWTLHHADSVKSVSTLLKKTAASVVITERDLMVADWTGVLTVIRRLPRAPLLIVISRLADNYLWAEALNLGAYDVLAKPLDRTETARVLTSAWIRRRESAISSRHPTMTTSGHRSRV